MNNKGFAITTILYGIMVLFCFLLVSLLGILSSYRRTQEKLIENTNGARAIANGNFSDASSSNEEPSSSSSPSTNEKPSESSSNPSPGGSSREDSEKKQYDLIYDCGDGFVNGGSKNKYPEKYYPGDDIDLLDITCKRSGYLFMGWNTYENAKDILRSSTYEMPNNNLTLYAVWKSTTGNGNLVTE